MKTRRSEQIGQPCVWADVDAGAFRFPCDPPGLREAAAARQIRLHDVDSTALDQLSKSPGSSFLFARGETPADVEASLREAHGRLEVVIT